MNGEMQIGNVTFHDDGTNLMVQIQVRNTSNRTLHAYASLRGIEYNEATKTLKLRLSDRNTPEMPMTTTFMLPRFTSVDPNGEATITVRAPRFQTRMAPGANMQSPALVKLPIHEAQTVEGEVSWSDTPFYSDPRKTRKTTREQLVDWEKGMAVGRGGKQEPPPNKAD